MLQRTISEPQWPTTSAGCATPSTNIDLGIVFFDGDCGVCSGAIGALRQRAPRWRFVAHQACSDADLGAWGLTHRDCDAMLQVVVARDRQVLGGAAGVNEIIGTMGRLGKAVRAILSLPPVLALETAAYRIFAANRKRISRRES